MAKGKKGNDMVSPVDGQKEVTAESVSEQPPTSEQPLTGGEKVGEPKAPDFAALSETTHNITEGATFPGETEPEQTQRGRPRLSDEERAAAKERKRLKDKERRARSKHKPAGQPSEDTPDPRIAVAEVNAAMVCKVLDVMAAGISAGQYVPSEEQQIATKATWSAYLYEEGLELPGWVQVTIVSCMHVLPAFATDKGSGRLSGWWARVKGWWVARRG